MNRLANINPQDERRAHGADETPVLPSFVSGLYAATPEWVHRAVGAVARKSRADPSVLTTTRLMKELNARQADLAA